MLDVKEKLLVDKSAISGFTNNVYFNEKIASLATTANLESVSKTK